MIRRYKGGEIVGTIDKIKNSEAAKTAAKKINEFMNPEDKNQHKEFDYEKKQKP